MNRRILFLLLVTVMMAAGGCKKFLDQAPDSTRTQLDSPEKVAQLLGTAYPQSNYITFAEAMSDNVADKGPDKGILTLVNRDPFYFEDVKDNQQDSPEAYWAACYTAIAAANQALEACEKATNPEAYAAQRGEALVARAYSHFMLVNFFSKFYDSTTAATDPGIPYVTVPETVVFKPYDRGTVKQVYDLVEKDLLEGMTMLRDDEYAVPRYHFTQTAAHAFASRFYLYKRNYQKVLEHAEKSIMGNTISEYLRPWNTKYSTMTYEELWDLYTSAEEPANLLLVETLSEYGRSCPLFRYGMDYARQQEIFSSAQLTNASATWAYSILYYGEPNYFVPKFLEYFVKTSVNANIGYPHIMMPLFTAEEVLFNRAEANTFLGNTSQAISDLNLFASKRIRNYSTASHTITTTKLKNYYGTSDIKLATLVAILDFRRSEYVQEGMRWFDILRYKLPVEHRDREGEVVASLASDDLRKVLQMPESVKTSGLPMNPR
ncbi:RagB/SusD family nutrient uptake outer membrane protein [Flavihumibacter petaseus]|uniref:SusD-like N-terminal domain-containing protein n=1 Tax=Flavihumibacter petaseus NBRC 106054 TaxID=1220578 RepID=A0A0E9MYV8_9BACT|nr:RagB/SusD family nutrient uptake outer membrane protein [Flavihumibacter petaseus]GAO42586.1 hypothetical protein FPE01S_01_16010 [Flavihumibacter petaseus NBRC 106054]